MGSDARQMVLAGLRGSVWRSLDAGTSWAQWATPTPASITGSALVPGSGSQAPTLVLVNQAGQVLQASGDTLAAVGGAPLPPLTGVLPLADGRVLALSVAGPMRVEGRPR